MDDASAPARPRPLHWGWRVGAASGSLLSAGSALWTGFVGVVAFTGCFIKCQPGAGDPLGGTLLFLGSAALVVATVAGLHLALVGSSRRLGVVAGVTTAVCLVAVAASVLTL